MWRKTSTVGALKQQVWPNLPYLSRGAYSLSCALLLLLLHGCNTSTLDTASAQRELGEVAFSQLGLSAEVLPGVVRSSDEESATVRMRLNAGVGRLILRTNERAQGTLLIQLYNVHPDARAKITQVQRLASTSTLENECPFNALSVDCVANSNNALCRTATGSRPEGQSTTMDLRVNLSPCRETIVEIEPPEERADDPVSFAVIGSLENQNILPTIVETERAAGREHDFYVLLGNALEDADRANISDLEQITTDLDAIFVALPGQEELADDQGLAFERRFGAFDYGWTLKNTAFVIFYSAPAQLSTRGLSNLDSQLTALEADDSRWRASNDYTLPEGDVRALPLMAFTHTPPFDPRGLRGDGFISRKQAAMVMSLLAEFQVDTLFAGRLASNESEDGTPRLRAVSSQDPRFGRTQALYLTVELTREQVAGSRRVNNRYISIQEHALP